MNLSEIIKTVEGVITNKAHQFQKGRKFPCKGGYFALYNPETRFLLGFQINTGKNPPPKFYEQEVIDMVIHFKHRNTKNLHCMAIMEKFTTKGNYIFCFAGLWTTEQAKETLEVVFKSIEQEIRYNN